MLSLSSLLAAELSHSWATDRLLEGFGSKSALSLSTARFEAKNSKSAAVIGAHFEAIWAHFGHIWVQTAPNCARARSYESLLEGF